MSVLYWNAERCGGRNIIKLHVHDSSYIERGGRKESEVESGQDKTENRPH